MLRSVVHFTKQTVAGRVQELSRFLTVKILGIVPKLALDLSFFKAFLIKRKT